MHLRGAAHVDPGDVGGRGQRDRTGHQHHLRALARGGVGDGETHLAAAAVADEADRIEVFEGRTRTDDDAASAQAHRLASASAATIASGSLRRPGPDSPSASGPSSGPITCTPRSRSVATLAWVAGCNHMRWFIAGATMIGAVVARHSVVTRSSAKPWVSLARVFAVAGATTTWSAQRASSMCPIAASAASSHSEVRTGIPDSAWK